MNAIPTWTQVRTLLAEAITKKLKDEYNSELALQLSRLDPPSEDQIAYLSDALARCNFKRQELERLMLLAKVRLASKGQKPVRYREGTMLAKARDDNQFDWSKTDAELSKIHAVSRERIRQIRKELALNPSPRRKLPPVDLSVLDPSKTLTANAKRLGITFYHLKQTVKDAPGEVQIRSVGMAAIDKALKAANAPSNLPNIALAEITGLSPAVFAAQRRQGRLKNPCITGHAWTIIRKKCSIQQALDILAPYLNSPVTISGSFFQKQLAKTTH